MESRGQEVALADRHYYFYPPVFLLVHAGPLGIWLLGVGGLLLLVDLLHTFLGLRAGSGLDLGQDLHVRAGLCVCVSSISGVCM